jgi:hypothetical protein
MALVWTNAHISDREIEWVQALADRLPDVEDHLQAAGEALAELDWWVRLISQLTIACSRSRMPWTGSTSGAL